MKHKYWTSHFAERHQDQMIQIPRDLKINKDFLLGIDNTCKHGVSYEIDGQAYWRCACCDPAFCFQQPKVEDIPHYIKLVELGEKK